MKIDWSKKSHLLLAFTLLLSSGVIVAQTNSDAAPARSVEELRRPFEQAKGSIYSAFLKAKQEDSSLKGKIVFEIKIAPSGEVLACRVMSSELPSPQLNSALLSIVRQMSFGAKDAKEAVVVWPIEFL